MLNFRTGAVVVGALLAMASPARGEDIDLFLQPAGDIEDGRPNVLFIIDNTANWNTAFENEKQALVNIFENLPLDRFNVGLMMFSDPDVPIVRAAIRPMSIIDDVDYRQVYADMINDWVNEPMNSGGDRGAPRTLARTFSEAYRYLTSQRTTDSSTVSSVWTVTRDYTGNTAGRDSIDAVHALPGNALDSATDDVYSSPINPDSCYDTVIIYIGNTIPSGNVVKDNEARNRAAGVELADAGGNITQIPLVYSSHQDNFADEWAKFLYENQGVITYTIDVDPTPLPGGQPNGMGNSNLLQSMANVSTGKYFRVDSQTDAGSEIQVAIEQILGELQAVNSVFASVSLPVSVNTQGFYLNQVYIGMFRPDELARPRWYGNLKQYRLGLSAGELRLLDARLDEQFDAINPRTGFIAQCARSFWTPDSTNQSYWSFLNTPPDGYRLFEEQKCTIASTYQETPDGPLVEKGAQGFMLRGTSQASRNLWTCTGSCGSLDEFDTSTVTPAMLGAADDAERDTLVAWQRGADVDDENGNGNRVETRPSAHGDVIHSRPVAINYGLTAADTRVIVFYGGNDGTLRAVNGNRSAAVGSTAAGDEMWSFLAPEFLPQIKRMRANSPKMSYTGAPTGDDVPRQPKPYGMDGPVSAYKSAVDTWIFAGLRRGGRVLYGFDVSGLADEVMVPPELMWKIGCPNLADDLDCVGDEEFEAMGQTWSEPKAIKTLYDNQAPLLIMGGGYDSCEDSDPHTCTSAAKGRQVFVIDAESGAFRTALGTDRPVVGDVFVVPDGNTGRAKLAYAADMGGNVYRISGATANSPFGSTDPADWTITKIASLGCDDPGVVSSGDPLNPNPACPMNRKFMFAPDVVEDDGIYYLLVGSGDREKPIRAFDAAVDTQNYFFMIKDSPLNASWLTAACGVGTDVICLDSLVDVPPDSNPAPQDLLSAWGWKLPLRPSEQAVTSAITVFGLTTFSTHEPTVPVPGACTSNLGTARVYNVRFRNAAPAPKNTARDGEVSGGGLPPSPVAGEVQLDDGRVVPFIFGSSTDSSIDPELPVPPAAGSQPKAVTYWYIEK